MDDRIAADAVGAVCGADGCEAGATATAGTILPDPTPLRPAARLDIVSDAICPWCWVGKRNMEAAMDILAREDGERFAVHWRPFQLNPDMPKEGVERAAYRAAKFGSVEKSRQLDAQVAAAGANSGLTFRHDLMRRTPNTVDAHRLIQAAGEAGGPALQNRIVEALFQGYFQDGRDIGDRAVLAAIAGEAGMDAVAMAAYLAGDAGMEQVIGEDAGFRQMGLSGVPTFALAGHVLFSGAMPPETMADRLRQALGILRQRGLIGA